MGRGEAVRVPPQLLCGPVPEAVGRAGGAAGGEALRNGGQEKAVEGAGSSNKSKDLHHCGIQCPGIISNIKIRE